MRAMQKLEKLQLTVVKTDNNVTSSADLSANSKNLKNMKTIRQNTSIKFHSISIQEAIVMLPVMDKLCEELAEANNDIHRHGNDSRVIEDYYTKCEQVFILLKLGFVPSHPGRLQFDPQYTPAHIIEYIKRENTEETINEI